MARGEWDVAPAQHAGSTCCCNSHFPMLCDTDCKSGSTQPRIRTIGRHFPIHAPFFRILPK